jgi:hypothetical protein
MSKTISFSLNTEEIIELCNKLGVLESDLGKSAKSFFTDKIHSGNYPIKFKQEIIQEWKDENLKAPQDAVKDMSEKELREILGITKTGKNMKNKIREKGLYFKTNTEDSMMNFISHWDGDPYRILEIRKELTDYMKQEFAVREFLSRGFEI